MAELDVNYKLNPDIWPELNRDVLLNVIEQSDVPTQINWSCTSRDFFLIVSSKIWRSLRIRSSDITTYYHIVSGQQVSTRANGILHFLLENSYRRHLKWGHVFARDRTDGVFIHRLNGVERFSKARQLTATLPIAHLKNVEIDNQGFDEKHPICSRIDMDHVLAALLKRIPTLQSFTYGGPLSAKNLATIVQVDALKILEIRNSNDVLQISPSPARVINMPWIDLDQDWSILANLKALQALKIGRVIRCEAGGLAKGIASLNLRKLHVSCWGWELDNSDPRRSMPSSAHTSALVMFLNALLMLDIRGGQAYRGLPSTLEHIVLIDKYHTSIPSLHQLLATERSG